MDAFLDRAHPLLRPGSSPGPSSLGDSSFPSSSLAPALPGSQERGTYRYKATTQAVFYLDGEEVFSLKLYLGQPEVQFSLVAKPSVVFATSQDRGIAFIDSDCPDKVCVHTGVLRASNSMAACLPNRLILVLEPINSD